MSQVLIITYDLHSPAQNYQELIGLIKGYSSSWAKLGGSVYLISTESTPPQVRDSLVRVLEPNDKLFVGVCPAPSAWYGMPDDVTQWIHANQTLVMKTPDELAASLAALKKQKAT